MRGIAVVAYDCAWQRRVTCHGGAAFTPAAGKFLSEGEAASSFSRSASVGGRPAARMIFAPETGVDVNSNATLPGYGPVPTKSGGSDRYNAIASSIMRRAPSLSAVASARWRWAARPA